MLLELAIAAFVVSCTIAVETAAIAISIATLWRMSDWLGKGMGIAKLFLVLNGVTLWMLAALFGAVWIWSLVLILLGAFDTLEESLYFTAVAFTTLGFGDITLGKEWRLLSGAIAANGLILFSLSTAFLFDVFRRLHEAREDGK